MPDEVRPAQRPYVLDVPLHFPIKEGLDPETYASRFRASFIYEMSGRGYRLVTANDSETEPILIAAWVTDASYSWFFARTIFQVAGDVGDRTETWASFTATGRRWHFFDWQDWTESLLDAAGTAGKNAAKKALKIIEARSSSLAQSSAR